MRRFKPSLERSIVATPRELEILNQVLKCGNGEHEAHGSAMFRTGLLDAMQEIAYCKYCKCLFRQEDFKHEKPTMDYSNLVKDDKWKESQK